LTVVGYPMRGWGKLTKRTKRDETGKFKKQPQKKAKTRETHNTNLFPNSGKKKKTIKPIPKRKT